LAVGLLHPEKVLFCIEVFIGAKKLEDLQNTFHPVISNAFLFHKCLASNSLKMQNYLGGIK